MANTLILRTSLVVLVPFLVAFFGRLLLADEGPAADPIAPARPSPPGEIAPAQAKIEEPPAVAPFPSWDGEGEPSVEEIKQINETTAVFIASATTERVLDFLQSDTALLPCLNYENVKALFEAVVRHDLDQALPLLQGDQLYVNKVRLLNDVFRKLVLQDPEQAWKLYAVLEETLFKIRATEAMVKGLYYSKRGADGLRLLIESGVASKDKGMVRPGFWELCVSGTPEEAREILSLADKKGLFDAFFDRYARAAGRFHGLAEVLAAIPIDRSDLLKFALNNAALNHPKTLVAWLNSDEGDSTVKRMSKQGRQFLARALARNAPYTGFPLLLKRDFYGMPEEHLVDPFTQWAERDLDAATDFYLAEKERFEHPEPFAKALREMAKAYEDADTLSRLDQ